MFALVFRFPAGRYHATPWGRNVNEADVSWPPEPWRILRALIATYWRKGDRERWSEDDLSALIDALAEELPVYRLPDGVVHAHTRHYMPAPVKTTLVFDAFARLPADAEIVAAWPGVALPQPLFALAADLARGIGYLGRAESWVECEATADWIDGKANCRPEGEPDTTGEPTRLIAPRSPSDYAAERARLLSDLDAREIQAAAAAGRKAPTGKALAAARAKAFGATLPERLVDALALDTSDYQRCGWSRPPASREAIYIRAPLTPTPRVARPSRAAGDDRARFTVARFVLAGRPRPRIEAAVAIGDLMRRATLSKFDWIKDENGRCRPNAPSVISGHGEDGRPLRGGDHRHAFWLPEDADGDGEIDHVVVYAKDGFDAHVRGRLDRVTRLWTERAPRITDEDGAGAPEARREWRLALEGFGVPEDFSGSSRLLGRSRRWESVTPFLAAGHLKAGGYASEIRRLAARRGCPALAAVEFSRPRAAPESDAGRADDVGIEVHGRLRRAIHFDRFRPRGRERQLDTLGTFLKLTFAEPVEGPLAFGYGCHFGLGLFASRVDGGACPRVPAPW
ncbi:type I-U CRISPR-associated protein Csb2 [Rhodoplanes azumiensis]|uniref:Type I-U CRISPR-associated protein Csb2 n=1 Tax=Rhodoplanes azumiensis TaxID=1897628 RepID=A0ABW5ALV3_9BRAD